MMMSGIKDGNTDEQLEWLTNIKYILNHYNDNKYTWSLFVKELE